METIVCTYDAGEDAWGIGVPGEGGVIAMAVPDEELPEGEKAAENARRLVACWNACMTIPTKVLEEPGVASRVHAAIVRQ